MTRKLAAEWTSNAVGVVVNDWMRLLPAANAADRFEVVGCCCYGLVVVVVDFLGVLELVCKYLRRLRHQIPSCLTKKKEKEKLDY